MKPRAEYKNYTHDAGRMIIECEFTNASDFKRERVVFLTSMQLMVDASRHLFGVHWERNKAEISLPHLHRAMHDSAFRIRLDRGGWLMTLAKWPLCQRSLWCISINEPRGVWFLAKICQIQKAIRRWVVRRRLEIDRVFSKAATANRMLLHRLNPDVVSMIVLYCMRQQCPLKFNPTLKWIKPMRDGQIFD